MALAVSAGETKLKPNPKPNPAPNPAPNPNPAPPKYIQACGECPPGACPDINGKPLLTFEDPKPLDGKPDTWHAIQAGSGDPKKKLDVTITKGTHENANDDSRLFLHVEYPGPEMGCWVIGITDSADPNKVEHYGALNGLQSDPKGCEKVFQMPQKTTNKIRAWKLGDGRCPDPLLWHA